MKVDILDYLGTIQNGALVLISIVYENEYYEGTFYYNKDNILALTVEERLEKVLGCSIEEWRDYNEIMVSLIKRVVPVNEIVSRLDEIDIKKYTIDAINKQIVYVESEEGPLNPTQSEKEQYKNFFFYKQNYIKKQTLQNFTQLYNNLQHLHSSTQFYNSL
jgi:hypothetical protein